MAAPTPAEVSAALDVIKSATVAPVVAEVTTIGQSIDARLAVLEAAAKQDVASVKNWVKTNWAHVVTWVGVAYSSGALSAVLKHV